MAKQKLEKFDHNREYNWLIISQSYLQCALVNARILNKKLSEFAMSEDFYRTLKEIYGDYPQSPEYLIFPILFNFKHGIEIYLKSIIGIQNSEFPKDHNLLNLLDKANIKNDQIECIIKKYAFGRLSLPHNNECDIENQFERYPQGNPYDDIELFPTILNSGYGNDVEIMPVSPVGREEIAELINDIEVSYKIIRKIVNDLL